MKSTAETSANPGPSKRTASAPNAKRPAKSKVKPSNEASATRDDKVARAKKLLQDTRYPSPEVIHSVADLLAKNWHRPQDS